MTDLDDELAPLAGSADVEPRASERMRLRAQNVLSRERRLAQRPWLARAERIYSGGIEPLFVASTVAGYLAWAVHQLMLMHP